MSTGIQLLVRRFEGNKRGLILTSGYNGLKVYYRIGERGTVEGLSSDFNSREKQLALHGRRQNAAG